mgnify:CR=1 FL=1
MSAPIKHQVIEKNGVPLFVIVPYEEYLQNFKTIEDEGLYLPNEVVKAHAIDGKTILRAWREFKGLTQQEMANRMNISQSAYSQIERSEKPHENTIRKAALALRIDWRLLIMD